MYKVKERFEKIAEAKPSLSSYMVYAETVSNTGLTEDAVRRWFRKLVDADDYAKSEAPAILRYLVTLAEPSK